MRQYITRRQSHHLFGKSATAAAGGSTMVRGLKNRGSGCPTA
jgi:hypothetical protein